MPVRRCLKLGCPETTATRSYCPKHRGGGWASYQPPWAHYYQSAVWKRRRADQLAQDPLCAQCGASASHADHVVAVAAGGDFDGPLQSLCARCHRRKTAGEGRARG
jgi:5-methylcytosine-specific restriction endonuclease McrA